MQELEERRGDNSDFVHCVKESYAPVLGQFEERPPLSPP